MADSRRISNDFDADFAAMDEVAQAERDYHVLGVINDEKAFLSSVKSIDSILARKNTPSRVNAIVYDDRRAWYFDTVVALIRESRLTIKELATELERVANTIDAPLKDPKKLIPLLMKWLRYPTFEPAWHIARRGDTKPLPTSKNKDLWGYLRGLYTDPEKVRLREPDYVTRNKGLYVGYEDCIKRARRECTAEMKRRYGDDVDLSPVTDLPKTATASEMSFIDMLRNGTFGDSIDA